MTYHKRHSSIHNGVRTTVTNSSDGSYVRSTSTGSSHNKITSTVKSGGESYTTYTTRRSDGSYESRRVGNHKPKEHKAGPVYTYSWEDREHRRMERAKRNQSHSQDNPDHYEEFNELPKFDWYFGSIIATVFVVLLVFYFTTILPLLM